MTEQEIQKQIEAVRGLIEVYDELSQDYHQDHLHDDIKDKICLLRSNISTLTQALKPYLNGEKLEV